MRETEREQEREDEDLGDRLDRIGRKIRAGTREELREAREALDRIGDEIEESREDLEDRWQQLKRRVDRKLD